MTIPVSNVDVVIDTFGSWVQKTNQIAGIITANAVTVDSTSTGSISTGNGFVNGVFGACTLVASVIRGSNVAARGPLLVDADLIVNGAVTFNILVANADLIPTPNNTYRVGKSGNVWSEGHFTTAYSNTIFVGGHVVNTSGYSGTANNSLHLGGVPAANYVNTSGAYTITGVHTMSANLVLNSRLIAGGGPGTSGQVLKSTGTGVEWGGVVTGVEGTNTTVQFNDSSSANGTTGFTFNKVTNSVFVANTITIGTATVNSTVYTGTANNTTNLDGQTGSFYRDASNINAGTLANTRLSGTYNITANDATHLGGAIFTNYTNTSGAYTITGVRTMSANLVLNSGLIAGGGPGTPGQVLLSTGSGVQWGAIGISSAGGSNTNIQFNDGGNLGGTGGFTFNKITNNVSIGNTLTIGIGTTATVNSTIYSGTANNATNLGGQSASYYRDAGNMNAGILASARLSGTYSITAANSSALNGQSASFYTDIPARLGYTPVNRAGDTMSGDLSTTGTFLSAGGGSAGEKRLRLHNSTRDTYFYVSSSGGTVGLYDATSTTTRLTTDASGNMVVTGTISCAGLNASQLTSGTVPVNRLGSSGTRDSSTFLRGDNTWATGGTVSQVSTGNGLTGGPITSSGTVSVLANSGIVANSAGVHVLANSGIVANSAGVHVLANSGIVANSTGVRILANSGIVANSAGVFVDVSNITAGVLPIARGGTGGDDALEARTNLGAAGLSNNTFTATQVVLEGGRSASLAASSLTFTGSGESIFQSATDGTSPGTGGINLAASGTSRFRVTSSLAKFLVPIEQSDGSSVAPRPTSSSGVVGQWVRIDSTEPNPGNYIATLPSGGTWAWFIILNGAKAGVNSGGTQIGSLIFGEPGTAGPVGFAWRIT